MLTKVILRDSFLSVSSKTPLNQPCSASFARASRSSRFRIHKASPDIILRESMIALYKLFWFRLDGFLICFFFCRRRSTSSVEGSAESSKIVERVSHHTLPILHRFFQEEPFAEHWFSHNRSGGT